MEKKITLFHGSEKVIEDFNIFIAVSLFCICDLSD